MSKQKLIPNPPEHLGQSTDFDIIDKLLTLNNKAVLDVGCGDGRLAAAMAGRGASVVGVEPDPVQAELNRLQPALDGVELLRAGAQSLPFDNECVDAVVLCYSLHHIPARHYIDVFRELARVLKPKGRLLVLEPIAGGSSHYVMQLFHDETEVRLLAQQALVKEARQWFLPDLSTTYTVVRRYPDFDAYVARYGMLSYNNYAEGQVTNRAVERRFLEYQLPDGIVTLEQPIKADLLVKK